MFEILKTLVYLPWVKLTGFLVYLPLSTIWTTPKIVRKKIFLEVRGNKLSINKL